MVKGVEASKKLIQLDEELEAAKRKRKSLQARLLKLKLAGINLPKYPSTPEARRGLIQNTKSPSATLEGTDSQTQDRLGAEIDFINTGKPIRPTGSGRKISTNLKRKLAKLKKKTDEVEDIEVKAAKEHGHSIVFKTAQKGLFRSASLESQRGKFAKYWLLNAKQTNGNGWGISAKTAKENMKKFIGRPLVITSSKWHGASIYGESYEHPYLPTNDLNQIFAHQEQFRVGSITAIDEADGDFYATIKMLPKFANMTLPPFCSPAIYQLDAKEQEGQISKWEALHLAALDENPAYGAQIALLKGTCVGTGHECKVQFRGAKQEPINLICPKKIASMKEQLKKNNRLAKLKLKLASEDVENALRGMGRSVDASHTSSSWLSQRGDFIGGNEPHYQQIQKPENKKHMYFPDNGDEEITKFSRDNNLPRVQTFKMNRAGENRVSVGIHSKINPTQLKSIQDLEKGGRTIGFAVGPDHKTATTGEGSRDLVKALRVNKFL